LTVNAFLRLQPGASGNCPAPANGGTTTVGCRFVLDLILNAGSNPDATSQQSYLTFTFSLIQNARVTDITSTSTLTSTATGDLTTFDATLQNEVCNGPGSCTFRGVSVGPGSFAYANGDLDSANCGHGAGCGGVFRVAQVGLCALATGAATLRWQF